jgi:fructoselysine 6-kinase
MDEARPLVVAAVGDNTIDRYLRPGGAEFVGGNALNVAVQLSTHGIGAEYFGAIGDDADGATIETVARAQGLGLRGLARRPGTSAVTEIRVLPNGDRVFEREDFGVTADYYPDAAALTRIASADWIHIGMLPRAAELVADIAQIRPGAPISQDCAVSAGYGGLQVAFCSAGESLESARRLADAAISGGAAVTVVTRAAAGVIAFDGRTWWEQPAVPITVVDTTGAGDSLIAGFIEASVRGDGPEGAIRRGTEWAARTCQHRAGFPQ